jgi:beta-lactam-binding protein with PASTA domain
MNTGTQIIVASFIQEVEIRANSFRGLSVVEAQKRALTELRPEFESALKAAGISGGELREAMSVFG